MSNPIMSMLYENLADVDARIDNLKRKKLVMMAKIGDEIREAEKDRADILKEIADIKGGTDPLIPFEEATELRPDAPAEVQHDQEV